jgi:nucleoside-diphosphate-sugar epimerase
VIDEWLGLARFGLTTLAGAPDGYQPSIHLDDAASAVVAALHAPSGTYNVAEEPLTKRDFLSAFAAAFGLRRAPRPTPGWLMRLIAGDDIRYLIGSQRVSSGRFRDATGWRPCHASAREGWLATARARGRAV